MKYNAILILTILTLTFTVGCTPKTPVTAATEVPTVVTEATSETPEATTEPDTNTVEANLDALIATNPDPLTIKKFILEHSNGMDKDLATVALSAWINTLDNSMTPEIDLYYSEDSQGLHEAISNTITANPADFESQSTVLSTELSGLLKGIKDPKHIQIITSSFEKGYALVSAEGSYYPVTDYVSMSETLGNHVTPNMAEYLKLMALEQKNPLTNEEYLAVSPNELGQRALSYENYLSTYPEGVYRENIRILFMTSLWKLVYPTPFDGLLTEEFKISPDLAATYDELLKHAEAPVVLDSVKGILAFSESQNGILGSFDSMDVLSEESYKLHQIASDDIKKRYQLSEEIVQ